MQKFGIRHAKSFSIYKTSRPRRGLLLSLILLTALTGTFLITRPAQAATRTWDGGGGANTNWSTCTNWSLDTCPVAGDTVTFDNTSDNNSTVDASYVGTIAGVNINSGYDGALSLSRSLTVNGNLSQASGSFNGGSNLLNIQGALILSGNAIFTAPSTTLNVGQNLTFGASTTFNHNGGTLSFGYGDGTASCNNAVFNLVTINKSSNNYTWNSDCTLPLGNNPTIINNYYGYVFNINGELTGTGTLTADIYAGGNALKFNAGSQITGFTGLYNSSTLTLDGANLDFSDYTTFNVANFVLQNGADFTAPTGIMHVRGDFTLNSGTTFNNNGGTLDLTANSGTASCNNTVFNLVTITKVFADFTINSDCNLPLGHDPTITNYYYGLGIFLNGTLSGTGTLYADLYVGGDFLQLNSGSHLSGFTGLSMNDGTGLVIDGAEADFSDYTTLDLYQFTSQNDAEFTAPSGTMNVGGDFTLNTGTTFNANDGTVAFDVPDSATLACDDAVFNLVTITHAGSNPLTIKDDCNLPLGSNPSVGDGTIILEGALTGSGTLSFTGFYEKTLKGTAALDGFNNLNVESTLSLDGYSGDLSDLTNITVGNTLFTVNNSSFVGPDSLSIAYIVMYDTSSINLGDSNNVNIGTITFSSATSSFTAPSGTMTISSGINNQAGGTFDAHGGTVLLRGADQGISGSNTFYNLVKTDGGGQSLQFGPGDTQTILGELTLTGSDSNNRLNLNANDSTNTWYIDPQGTTDLEFLTVTNSTNSSGTDITANNSVDEGNNSGWIFNAPPLQITTTDLDRGVVGEDYEAEIETAFGAEPFTYSIVSGSLPSGLELDAGSGEISGTPTTEGVFNFTVQVKDDDSNTDTADLSIEIMPTPVPYLASDVLGQTDEDDNPDFTTNDEYNGILKESTPGLRIPAGVALDSVNHRLFVAESASNRVLVYNLNSSDEPIDLVPDFVLGQPDFVSNGNHIDVKGFNNPQGLALNAAGNRLYVADVFNHRVLVFDTTTITDNEDAVNVLGQPDFTSGNPDINAKGFNYPQGLAYDSVNDRLFVADTNSSRVLVFDTTTITDNEDAVNVLGQPDFTSGNPDTDSKGFSNPQGLAFNTAGNRLYVADSSNNRVLVFDTTTITDNEDAVNVLGQPGFVSNGNHIDVKGFSYPGSLTLNTAGNRLYVADLFNNRVLVFDTTTITDNEDAVNVLGQPDFTSNGADIDAKGFSSPYSLTLNTAGNRLYAADSSNNRVLVFDTTTITDNEDAVSVLGQTDDDGNPSFTTGAPDNGNGQQELSARGFEYPQGTTMDTVNHRLFVSECGSRVTVFNLDSNNNLLDHTADYVIGQDNFSSEDNPGATQNRMGCPVGSSYDSKHQRLFVPDDSGDRVMVFDLSGGITNGMNASWVLGQPDFETSNCETDQNTICDTNGGSAYDPETDYFYVSDSNNNARVLVYDLSGGITNGMNASWVLGQPDFGSNDCAVSQDGITYPYGIALDSKNHRLFVADDRYCSSNHSARVLVYDLSGGLTNGMNAAYVLGQPDFTSFYQNNDPPNKANLQGPEGLAYDSNHQRLFVYDDYFNRILVFDVNSITNGEDAIAVIGQPDFTSENYDCEPSQDTLCDSEGLSDYYDTANDRLYISDSDNNRVMIFNFIQLTSTSLAAGTTGSSYSQAITSQHSQGSVSYAVASGSLPLGLTLNPNGTLSGTPTVAGTYTFNIRANDDLDAVGSFYDTGDVTVTINQGASAPAAQQTSKKPSTNQSSQAPGTSTPLEILLNAIEGFLTGKPITLQGLKVGDKVSFCLANAISCDGQQIYTFTVKAINPDNVVLTLDSQGRDITFKLSEAQNLDLDGDGTDDIRITLAGVNGNLADITFERLTGAKDEKTDETPLKISAEAAAKGKKSSNKIPWIIGLLLFLGFIAWLLWRRKNKKDGDSNQPPTNPTIVPPASTPPTFPKNPTPPSSSANTPLPTQNIQPTVIPPQNTSEWMLR